MTPSSTHSENLPRGVSASTTGVFVLDVLALATMAACVPTLLLFAKKRRRWNLVRGKGKKEKKASEFFFFSLSTLACSLPRLGSSILSLPFQSFLFAVRFSDLLAAVRSLLGNRLLPDSKGEATERERLRDSERETKALMCFFFRQEEGALVQEAKGLGNNLSTP